MLLEILIVMEILAFLFLALGIIPFQGKSDEKELRLPLLNKVLFMFVATIIFFMLGMTSASYDYNYCYINVSTLDYALNQSVSTATCASYLIESLDLSFLNFGMGMVSILLAVIMILFVISFNKERKSRED